MVVLGGLERSWAAVVAVGRSRGSPCARAMGDSGKAPRLGWGGGRTMLGLPPHAVGRAGGGGGWRVWGVQWWGAPALHVLGVPSAVRAYGGSVPALWVCGGGLCTGGDDLVSALCVQRQGCSCGVPEEVGCKGRGYPSSVRLRRVLPLCARCGERGSR